MKEVKIILKGTTAVPMKCDCGTEIECQDLKNGMGWAYWCPKCEQFVVFDIRSDEE